MHLAHMYGVLAGSMCVLRREARRLTRTDASSLSWRRLDRLPCEERERERERE
jgi:hypothetical protein